MYLKLSILSGLNIWIKYVTKYRNLSRVAVAFTLAEVLITLLIIGVVASLIVPTLINDAKNAEYTTKLEKAFSTLNNGFKLIKIKAGCSDMVCTELINTNPDITVTNIVNTGVFSIVKKCNDDATGCHDKLVHYFDGSTAWIPGQHYSLFVTNDGIVFGLTNINQTCSYVAGTGRLANSCNRLGFIDVNGESPPNKFGRDVFRFYLLKDGGVVPVGMSNDTDFRYWNNSSDARNCMASNARGETCAARIMQEGWQMNY